MEIVLSSALRAQKNIRLEVGPCLEFGIWDFEFSAGLQAAVFGVRSAVS